MAVNATHQEYGEFAAKWSRARDIIAGEDTIKAAGTQYLPRLLEQSDEEYAAYVARASFYNATARTAEGFNGMIFRRDPVIKLPDDLPSRRSRMKDGDGGMKGERAAAPPRSSSRGTEAPLPGPLPGAERGTDAPFPGRLPNAERGSDSASLAHLARVFEEFRNDVDCLGTSLYAYAKRLVGEVLAVGRAGTLIEWNDEEGRAFLCQYQAEQILNWRMSRIGGRNVLSLVVLKEIVTGRAAGEDEFESEAVEQIRVLKLARISDSAGLGISDLGGKSVREAQSNARDGSAGASPYQYVVEIWQKVEVTGKKKEWVMVERRVPMRAGMGLTAIPFVFHGPLNSLPECAKPPLEDVIALNLDYYRLNADYKHGLHFTALPTAWVSGFEKDAVLRIGSSNAWVSDQIGAQAGFLEFKGQGLETFERAMDRVERLMAILGSRLLEAQKRVSESAEALTLRQAGEGSIVANIASSLSKSLTEAMRWVYWWCSGPQGGNSAARNTNEELSGIGQEIVSIELNKDYETATMTAQELVALVQAWQAGALSRESMLNLMRRGELLEPGRTNEEEVGAVKKDPAPAPVQSDQNPAQHLGPEMGAPSLGGG